MLRCCLVPFLTCRNLTTAVIVVTLLAVCKITALLYDQVVGATTVTSQLTPLLTRLRFATNADVMTVWIALHSRCSFTAEHLSLVWADVLVILVVGCTVLVSTAELVSACIMVVTLML